MGKPYRRTRLWVDPPFQSRLLLRMTFYFVLYMVLAWHVGFLFEVLAHVATNTPDEVTGELYVAYFWKQKPLLLAMVIVLPIFLKDLVKFSHRVAGPLFRCRHLMRDMADGKPVPEFKSRKHDLMQELFQAFNALIKTFNARIAAANNGQATHLPVEETTTSKGSAPAQSKITTPVSCKDAALS